MPYNNSDYDYEDSLSSREWVKSKLWPRVAHRRLTLVSDHNYRTPFVRGSSSPVSSLLTTSTLSWPPRVVHRRRVPVSDHGYGEDRSTFVRGSSSPVPSSLPPSTLSRLRVVHRRQIPASDREYREGKTPFVRGSPSSVPSLSTPSTLSRPRNVDRRQIPISDHDNREDKAPFVRDSSSPALSLLTPSILSRPRVVHRRQTPVFDHDGWEDRAPFVRDSPRPVLSLLTPSTLSCSSRDSSPMTEPEPEPSGFSAEDDRDRMRAPSGKIQKPPGEAGRPGRNGYNIERQLNWPSAVFNEIRTYVHQQSAEFLNLSACFSKQESHKIGLVIHRATESFPILKRYENSWPVTDLLKLHLKNSRAKAKLRWTKKLAEEALRKRKEFKKIAKQKKEHRRCHDL